LLIYDEPLGILRPSWWYWTQRWSWW